MRKKGIVVGLRGQVILCCVCWSVCARMDTIILSIRVLFEVGGLDGGSSEHHVAAVHIRRWKYFITAFVPYSFNY